MVAFLSTIRGRIQLLILLAVVPAALLVVFNAFTVRQRQRSEVQEQAALVARLVMATQQRLAETTDHLFVATSLVPSVTGDDPSKCAHALQAIVRGTRRFQNIGLIADDGRVTCSAQALPQEVAVSDAKWFREAVISRQMSVSSYEEGALALEPSIVFARRLDGGAKPVMFAALDLGWLSRAIPGPQLPSNSSVNVVDENGTILARHPDHQRWVGRNVRNSPIIAAALEHRRGVAELAGLDGVVRLYGYDHLAMPGGSEFIVTVGFPLETAYGAVNRQFRLSLAVLAAIFVGTVMLAAYTSERVLTRRVDALLRTARRLSAGDLSARTGDTSTADELGELSKAFDAMAFSLEARTQDLQQSNESLRALAARLEAVREEERTRISREIHDELGQNLTGIKMDLDRLQERIERASLAQADNQMVKAKIESVRTLADRALDTSRRISRQLRPSVLDVLGLRAGIEWQLEEFQARTGVKAELLAADGDPPLDEQSGIALFRILQEALTNVARHAQATQVTVRLAHEDASVVLEVMDNGRGFADAAGPHPRSLGLLGMRERAATLGGETSVTSEPGHGTTVHVRLPAHALPEEPT